MVYISGDSVRPALWVQCGLREGDRGVLITLSGSNAQWYTTSHPIFWYLRSDGYLDMSSIIVEPHDVEAREQVGPGSRRALIL